MPGVYLLQGDDQLIEMTERPYDSERLLQELLAKYPSLLAGDQIDSTVPRRWLLISRELGLPAEEEGRDRWSVDHLFLDQDAVPTLVEVKRSTNTEIRRKVVGQMLDYAANAIVYWPIEKIRATFEANCEVEGRSPEELLARVLDTGTDPEQFWRSAKTNLQAGKVRLVFVADKIPPELQRIVEFLNKQMDPAEVLAIEIKQYVGQGLRTLVPRVIGGNVKPPDGDGKGKQWDEASFFDKLQAERGADEARVAQGSLDWARARGLRVSWGRGEERGSFSPIVDHNDTGHWLVSVVTRGRVSVPFGRMRNRLPFDSDSKRLELLHRLKQIPGVDIPEDAINRHPNFPLSVLKDDAALKQFFEALDWMVAEIRAS